VPSTAGASADVADRRVDLVEAVGVGAVGDDREQLGALVRDLGEGELGELPSSSGVRATLTPRRSPWLARPLSTTSTGAPRFAAMRAL
jgi:hypothetical protein